jgi:flagellar biosynthesis/type III secretory pathway protein FliH
MTHVLKGRGVITPEYLKALASSREVIAAAERASEQVRRDAERRGHEEGMARAAAAIAEAETLRSRWLHAARRDLAAAAVEAAATLYARARTEDPSLVEEACAQALERVAGARRIAVRLCPDEARALEHLAGAGLASVEVVADETITPGGCVVETELGTVDGRLETRLDALRRALEEVIERYEQT